jgi:hypothetical protein
VSEPVQVRDGVIAELQRGREGVQDLIRGVQVAALFQAQVVLHADAGQQRDLLTPQARHPAPLAAGQASLLRANLLAPGPQEAAKRVRHGLHASDSSCRW